MIKFKIDGEKCSRFEATGTTSEIFAETTMFLFALRHGIGETAWNENKFKLADLIVHDFGPIGMRDGGAADA